MSKQDYHEQYPEVHLNEKGDGMVFSALIDSTVFHSHRDTMLNITRMFQHLIGATRNGNNDDDSTIVTFSVSQREVFDKLIEYNTLAKTGESRIDFMSIESKKLFDAWRAELLGMLADIDKMCYYSPAELHEKRRKLLHDKLYSGKQAVHVNTQTIVFNTAPVINTEGGSV